MSSMSGSLLQRAPRLLAIFIVAALLILWLAPRASSAPPGRPSSSAEQMLYDAVNHERLAMGLRELQWDTALASAARLHTALLADHDALSHRFDGEADLQTRLRMAGASFSLVAENVALAPDVPSLHIAWMNSAPHRANILDPHVNSVGMAIERRGNQLYATQDFSASVSPLTREDQERQVARLLEMYGVALAGGADEARKGCDAGRGNFGMQPAGIARFETSDLSQLPNELARMVSSGRYRRASVGACEVPATTPFARFRLTVLLYP
jgi:hypothetical protein